jgi:DNA-binding beta-propeller fold protein YncE
MKTKILIPLLVLIILVIGGILVYENVFFKEESKNGNQDCIHSDNYNIKLIMPTSFGLLAQLALLPNGDIAIGDSSNDQILLFHNNTFETIVSGDINPWAVAALPDGRIAYIKRNEVSLFDYKTKQEEHLGKVPGDRYLQALGSDRHGNIYVGTSGAGLFRFKDGKLDKLADSLPFSDLDSVQITDIAVGSDGIVYVAGFEKVFAVDSTGAIQLIAEGLVDEPVYLEVGPDGMVYVNELSHGLQRFDPKTKQLSQLNIRYQFLDMLALTANEFFVYDSRGVLYTLNLQNNTIKPLYTNVGNGFAFAAGVNDTVFFATPSLEPVLRQHIVELNSAGERIDLYNLEYVAIFAADVDNENRLTLLTNEGIVRLNHDGLIKTVPIRIEGREFPMMRNFAAGQGAWYVTVTDFNEKIEIFSVDEMGKVKFLPISFTRESLGAYKVDDARIDVAPDGSLALIVTAKGSASQGPYIQRVYRADADGSNLREIARLDSNRVAGMVDIAIGPDNSVFVLNMQGESNFGSDSIYKIDKNNEVTEVVDICLGRDPESIDVDSSGNIWFGSTLGVFQAKPAR